MKKGIKALVAAACMIVTMSVVSGCGNQEKVAYVDTNTIVQKSTKAQEIQKKLQDKNTEIMKRLEEAQKNQSEEEFKQTYGKAQQEAMVFKQAMFRDLQSYLSSNVEAVAKQEKYTIVIEKDAAASGATDITEQVLKKMNEQGSGSKDAEGTAKK